MVFNCTIQFQRSWAIGRLGPRNISLNSPSGNPFYLNPEQKTPCPGHYYKKTHHLHQQKIQDTHLWGIHTAEANLLPHHQHRYQGKNWPAARIFRIYMHISMSKSKPAEDLLPYEMNPLSKREHQAMDKACIKCPN